MFFPKVSNILQWNMFLEKIQIYLTWENDFESQNFAGPITLTKNFQKKFQRTFGDQWSIGSIFKSL